jgi:acylphosphatase
VTGNIRWKGTKALREPLGLWLDFAPNRRNSVSRGGNRAGGLEKLNSAAMAREQLQVYYSGRVQGIGFRATAKRVAHGYELTGIVRNLSDGRVELVAEGERNELEEFQQAIRDSGLGHFIRQEEARWGPTKNEFRGFEIVR